LSETRGRTYRDANETEPLTVERYKMRAKLTRAVLTLGLGLSLGCGSQLLAGTPSATHKERTIKGVASRIDPVGKTVVVKGFWGAKRLNVADDCKVTMPDRPDADLADLRAGQELAIYYQTTEGVRVANRIVQKSLTFAGVVNAIDPTKHTLTLRHHALDKTFEIGDECKVVLRDERAGTLGDVQPGHRVKVTYELPNRRATARQIAQTSATYSGALTAIDLTDRTVKAKNLVGEKQFNLANNCTVVLNGKPGGRLSDLKLGDKLVFNYDDVNGVNVVNRIVTGDTTREPPATASAQLHNSGPLY